MTKIVDLSTITCIVFIIILALMLMMFITKDTIVPFTGLDNTKPLLLSNLKNNTSNQDLRKLSKINYISKANKSIDLGYSGFFTVPVTLGSGSPPATEERNNNIFFWYQPNENYDPNDQKNTDFVLWLQGGPGAPGTFGALDEMGRWYVDPVTKDLKNRCFTWGKTRNCLYVDQPVQTGFSFQTDSTGKHPKKITYITTSRIAMEQILEVYLQFRDVFPEIKDSPFVIGGESYGGLYTPNLGRVVYEYNNQQYIPKYKTPFHPINFKALLCGDPVMDWSVQMPTYPDTLYSMGVIMGEEKQHLTNIYKKGVAELNKNCRKAFDITNVLWNDDNSLKTSLFKEYTGSGMTENVLMSHSPYPFKDSTKWLSLKDKENPVPKMMHYAGIPSASTEEGGEVYKVMVDSGDWCNKSTHIFADLFMNAGIDIMIYAGTADPLLGPPCAEAGIKALLSYTNSDVINQFHSSKKQIWKVLDSDENLAGYVKSFKNPHGQNHFYYTIVRNAGHETPSYQPRKAYDMLHRFRSRALDWSKSSKNVPTCFQCSGVGPFAGQHLPECHTSLQR